MANVFIESSTMSAIGDAIRAKTGGTDLILPANMATEIGNITTGGGGGGGGDSSGTCGWTKSFADSSWEEVIQLCQNNSFPNSWNVGDQKTMNIGGTNYTIDIIGKNHDTYTGGGTAPLTFQLHELYETKYQMHSERTNVGGYSASDMYTTHLPVIKSLMPTEVQAAIKFVDKLANVGNYDAYVETISCDLFLLGTRESANFNNGDYDGSQYQYYSEGGSLIKKQINTDTAIDWWLRAPESGQKSRYCCISASGTGNWAAPTTASGISFAFCF